VFPLKKADTTNQCEYANLALTDKFNSAQTNINRACS